MLLQLLFSGWVLLSTEQANRHFLADSRSTSLGFQMVYFEGVVSHFRVYSSLLWNCCQDISKSIQPLQKIPFLHSLSAAIDLAHFLCLCSTSCGRGIMFCSVRSVFRLSIRPCVRTIIDTISWIFARLFISDEHEYEVLNSCFHL